jgi:hypothetical protein
MFSRWYFTTDKAWERFKNGEPYLKIRDFACAKYFKKYFIISLGLLEGNCIVHGKEGGGKSLWAYHIAYQIKELFGKRCTLKPKPKKGFGDFDTITDEQVETEIEFLKELTGRANDLTEDDEISDDIQSLLAKSKLYNRVYVCDESYQELEKTRQTNVTRQYGRLVRQHRHLHTLFIFISPDKRDIAGRLIFDRRSHEVQCAKYGGSCHYTVIWKNEGITKPMELSPKEWAWLWDSHNLVSGGSKLKVKL